MSPFFLALLAASAPPATAGVHPIEVENRLARLVGDWTIQGLASNQFRQKCSWFGDKAFVVCSIDDKRNRTASQITFGYSALEKRYTYNSIDSTGRSQHQTGFEAGEYGLVFIDERPDSRGPARIQSNLMVEHDGLHFTEIRSVSGGEWQKTASYVLVPAKGPRPPARRRR